MMIKQRIESFLVSRVMDVAAWKWWLAGIVAFVGQQFTMEWLNHLYSMTKHPVSFFEGQTTFSGEAIKGHYAVLQEKDTLTDFINVQLYDYLYMVTVVLAFVLVCMAIYRSLPNRAWLKSLAVWMLIITPLAAVFDALENAVSFVMLANPGDFSNGLAYPYSTFAVVKFALFTLFYSWAIVGGLICLGAYLKAMFSRPA